MDVPHGWKLVPEQLTPDMLDALDFTDGDPQPDRRWQALLDAAPEYKEKGCELCGAGPMLACSREGCPGISNRYV